MTSSVRRTLKVLRIINAASEPIGVTEIAKRAGISPGTAFRSLDALDRCGFIERYRASTRFQIGSTTSRLKYALYSQFGLRNICMPYLRQLAFVTGETTYLVVPVGWYAVRISTLAGTRSVRTAAPMGIVGLLHETLAGRAILSTYSKPDMAAYLKFARQFGPLGITKAALEAQLQQIRSVGVAVDQADSPNPHVSTAIPILFEGKAIGAIAIDGPVTPLDHDTEHFEEWLNLIREIEDRVAQSPENAYNPFAHISPDEIVLTQAPDKNERA